MMHMSGKTVYYDLLSGAMTVWPSAANRTLIVLVKIHIAAVDCEIFEYQSDPSGPASVLVEICTAECDYEMSWLADHPIETKKNGKSMISCAMEDHLIVPNSH